MSIINFRKNSNSNYGIISGIILLLADSFFKAKDENLIYVFVALFASSFTLFPNTNFAKKSNRLVPFLPYFFASLIFSLFYFFERSYIGIHFSFVVVLFGLFFHSSDDKKIFEVDPIENFNRARLYFVNFIFVSMITLLASLLITAIKSLFHIKLPSYIRPLA
ncbi:MAG: hypothetical protein QE271_04765 [Bacteriovoracaceae bacterium]|nr:hypothetical protein [Bacteriovoracaceae bacterium]